MTQHPVDILNRVVPSITFEARYPYDPTLRSAWAEREYTRRQWEFPLGTRERARFLLEVINRGFPTPRLTEDYFATLDALLANRPVLAEPGQLVLGLGTGRTGSTSLAALLATVPDSVATHENPPHLFWTPLGTQLNFHKRRFHRLVRHMPLVVDVAHWWLPVIDAMHSEFPQMRSIALERDMTDCTNSFLRIKGTANRGLNHWAQAHNGIWTPGLWDSTYPSYPVPQGAALSPDKVKADMILRYVREYNTSLRELAAAEPDKWLMVRTERLSDPMVQRKIFEFVGRQGRFTDRRWNVGSTQDSERTPFWA